MATFTKFGYNEYGELVYRKTGKLAPSGYSVKGKTVYKDGRKVGQIGKGTAAERKKISKATNAPTRRRPAQIGGRFSFNSIKTARNKAVKTIGKLQLLKPVRTQTEIKNFGKSVKNMALLSVKEDPRLREKINAMDDAKLMQLYDENKLIFDVYFDYGGVRDTAKGRVGDKETAKNAQALIDVYEAKYGKIGVQAVFE